MAYIPLSLILSRKGRGDQTKIIQDESISSPFDGRGLRRGWNEISSSFTPYDFLIY